MQLMDNIDAAIPAWPLAWSVKGEKVQG